MSCLTLQVPFHTFSDVICWIKVFNVNVIQLITHFKVLLEVLSSLDHKVIESVIVLHFTFRSVIHLEFIFEHDMMQNAIHFFSICVSIDPVLFLKRSSFSHYACCYPFYLYCKSNDHKCMISFWTLYSVPWICLSDLLTSGQFQCS